MGWLTSLLLDSPVPPPVWLPTAAERHAQAKSVITGLFARRRPHRGWHGSHYLHDLGSVYGGMGVARVVPGDEIEEAVEGSLLHLNPPVFQGWAFGFAAAGLFCVLLAIAGAGNPNNPVFVPAGLIGLVIVIVGWLVLELVVGGRAIEIELCEHGVALRRWTDVWRNDPGRVIDEPGALEARFDADTLTLAGPTDHADVSLRLWPPSARAALPGDLKAWGVTLHEDVGPHHRRHH